MTSKLTGELSSSDSDCVIESLLNRPLGSRTFFEKSNIISNGRPTPVLKDLKTKSHGSFERHFNVLWYAESPWLCGSEKLSRLFCWPCLLFSNEKNNWNRYGVMNMDSFRVIRVRHENSIKHVASVVSLARFGKTRIDFSLSESLKQSTEKYNESVKRNRYVMSRLISVVCYLAQQELPFRGGEESADSINRGNYVELLRLLAQIDDKLDHHLQTATVFFGPSNSTDIQNDLIECVYRVLINEIKKEICETNFIAVIMDESTDLFNKSQLSTVFRYVTCGGNVEERFIGFCDVISDHRAIRLSKVLFDYMEEFKCSNKLVAQTYDGAAVMAGEHNGLQTIVREKYKQAMFAHCYAHKLNLVLQQSTSHIKQCKLFFQTVTGMSSFFTKSQKRTKALDDEVKERFPTVSVTGWDYRSRMIDVIFHLETELVMLFQSMMVDKDVWDGETRASATGYYHNLLSFDFRFLLLVFSCVFPQSDFLFDVLQEKIYDIDFCKQKIDDFKNHLSSLRELFDEVIWSKIESANEQQETANKRQRMDMDGNEMKASYCVLFYEIIDTIITQVTNRFSDIDQLQFLSLLDSTKYDEYNKAFPEHTFDALLKHYGQYFNIMRLRSELCYVYSCPEFQNKQVYEFRQDLYTMGVADALPEVKMLSELILTIPVSSISAEHSFSALQRIHTHLCNTQVQNRLTALSVLSVEKKLLRELQKRPSFEDSVIDMFLEKNQEINLKYK